MVSGYESRIRNTDNKGDLVRKLHINDSSTTNIFVNG
jgi:hypothetical protein